MAIVVIVTLVLSSCSANDQKNSPIQTVQIGGPDKFATLKSPPATLKVLKNQINHYRWRITKTDAHNRALRDEALRFGSQHGFQRRAWEIRQRLQHLSGALSTVYDFNRVAQPAPKKTGYLLPPVVSSGHDAFELSSDGETVSVADEYFIITRPASFSPVPPNWRDYLLFYPDTKSLHLGLQEPKSSTERKQQELWIQEGWMAGVEQAENELSFRFRRLKYEFEGMLSFRRLEVLGMVSAPIIEEAEFGITGEHGQMRIGDRTVKIVNHSDFQRNPANWRLKSH